MSGLVFLGTKKMDEINEFYINKIGMKLWLNQGGCRIFQHGNMLLGFCERDEANTEGIYTFFYETREELDAVYLKFAEISENPPRYNSEYDIYHFFCRDPENRIIELQKFENNIPEHKLGSDNLKYRRSIRNFSDEVPSKEVLNAVFELCKYSPTSMNSQKYYYVITNNQIKINILSKVRGSSSSPLAKAPFCVAVCCKPETRRVQQDADIAATYLLLAAYSQGLATCWITDMDREEVKAILDIPASDYITCLTPLGYPNKQKTLPQRRNISDFVKFV